MPNYRRYLIHIPTFSEYLFRAIVSAPEDRLRKLTTEERKMLSDKNAITRFCANGTFESLLFIFTKLGFEWTLSCGPTEESIAKAIEACEYQYDSSLRRLDAIESIQRNSVCVVSSRQVMETIMMCAQNCHTQVYNMTYLTQNLRKYAGPMKQRPYDMQMKEASDSATIVNKLMMEQLNSLEYAEEVLGFNLNKLRLLITLYDSRYSAMTSLDLAKLTHRPDKRLYIGRDLDALETDGYVTSERARKGRKNVANRHYMLTTKGLQAIGEYHNYIWERAFKE